MSREYKFRQWLGDEFLYGELIWNRFESNDYIMQYTGLKDKNGKEIYEGDILKHTSDPGEYDDFPYEISEVVFKNCKFMLKSWAELGWYNEDELEVIGNIHENPELLKNESEE